MDAINYLFEQSLILIPVLNIIGMVIKQIQKIPDKYIPLILLFFGIAGSVMLSGFTTQAVIQGILVTGTAVYGNQIVKQMKSDE